MQQNGSIAAIAGLGCGDGRRLEVAHERVDLGVREDAAIRWDRRGVARDEARRGCDDRLPQVVLVRGEVGAALDVHGASSKAAERRRQLRVRVALRAAELSEELGAVDRACARNP